MDLDDVDGASDDMDSQPALEDADLDDDDSVLENADDDTAQSTIVDSAQAIRDRKAQAKTTSPVLQKYERCRLLAVRITQLQLGAPPLVDTAGLRSDREIAEKELRERVLPLIVRRKLGPGRHEDWRLSDMVLL